MLNRLPNQLPPLGAMLEDIGNPSAKQIGRALGVTPASVQRWMRQDQAPRAVMLALFWVTRWGQSIVDADAHNCATQQAQLATALKSELRKQRLELERLAKIADFGCANDAYGDALRARALGLKPPSPGQTRQVLALRVTISPQAATLSGLSRTAIS